ncbi:SCO family protein [Puniceicoccaceae bacterium K14]|nr:SCO family protein [Puniceicoccaceae bacterium K14]
MTGRAIKELEAFVRLNKRGIIIWILPMLALCGLLGCSQSSESQADESEEGYPVIGEIEGIKTEKTVLTVKHEEIPGFMPAMTMDFRVSEGDLANAKVGEKIQARMIRDDDGGFRLIKIWPLDKKGMDKIEKANKALEKQMKKMSTGRYLGPEDQSPEIVLYDQFGEIFASTRLKGKAFVFNFIFTRCNDASMCPLSTSKMATLQRMAKEQNVPLELVSITLDPKYDTPGVLREYADAYAIDGETFHFLTGPKSAVYSLIRALGVTALPNEDQILHSLATTLVGPSGEILLRSEKKDWDPVAFLEKAK